MKNFLSIIFLFLFLSACNYQPIFSTKKSNFSITNFEIKNENSLTNKIVSAFTRYRNIEAERVYSIELSGEKNKEVTAKDSRGNIETYRMNIIFNFIIYENDKMIKTKRISKNFIFNNNADKFKLRKYESTIEKNLVDEIIKDLTIELYSS